MFQIYLQRMLENQKKKEMTSMYNFARTLRAMFFVLFTIFCLHTVSYAQMLSGDTASSSTEQNPITLPKTLTPEVIDKLVSRLSDKEVRDLLLERLHITAQENAANEGQDQSTLDVVISALTGIGEGTMDAVAAIPTIAGGFNQAYTTFMDGRGASGLIMFLAIIALSLALGYAAGRIVDWVMRPLKTRIQASSPNGLWEAVRTLLSRFGLDVVKVAVFAVVSLTASNYLHKSLGDSEFAGRFITVMIVTMMLFAAFGRFLLAPRRPDLRLMTVDDHSAHRFQIQTIWLAFFLAVTPFLLDSLIQYGVPMEQTRIGFWTNLAVHIFGLSVLYFSRSGVRQGASGNDNLMGPLGLKIAYLWPWVAGVLVVFNWMMMEMLYNAGRFDLMQGQTYVTLVLIMFSPVLDTAIRGVIGHLTPPMYGDGAIAERAYLATHRAYLRMGRIVLLGFLLLLLSIMFDIDYSSTNSDNPAEQLIASVFDGTLYFFLGYFVWEAAGVWINQRLAKEQTEAGFDLNSDEPGGGEGGGTGISRLATVLPVIRLVLLSTIAVMTLLLGLSRLGVDTTPLLAGAGIVGLAIGFGAQTLVRDVVSGIFFLIDDAFRVGEYLVIDDTVGTVEKISVRSLQLRHHKGAVHTIPYGEIPKVTNNSRDWTITKLKFTFPFETDPNKIKKIFKKVGAEMLEADYADDIIQTFKSQGVYDVDDVGMVIRGKFMTKPGTQWVIRKDIYSRIYKALEEAGIQFARREVRVQMPGFDSSKELTEDQAKTIGAAATSSLNEPKPA